MLRQVSHVILEQDELWPPTGNIETSQHLDFMTLHIDRQKMEIGRGTCFGQNAVQRPDRHIDDPFRRGPRRHAPAIK